MTNYVNQFKVSIQVLHECVINRQNMLQIQCTLKMNSIYKVDFLA